MDSLMKRFLVILSTICIVLSVFFAPSAFAEDEPPSEDSTSQEETTDSKEHNSMYDWQHEWVDNPNAPCPPFGGGPITGKWLEWRVSEDGQSGHNHEGLDIGIDDADILAPLDGRVWHMDPSASGFGEGLVYFVSDEPFESFGIVRLLFGDLDHHTSTMGSGDNGEGLRVKKGDVIGHVQSFIKPSTGAHVHVQYYTEEVADYSAPYLHVDMSNGGNTGPVRNPEKILRALRVDLSGVSYSGPNAGKIGADTNNKFAESFWTVESMKELGAVFNDLIKFWTEKAKLAIQAVLPYVYYLLLILCIFDLIIPILLAGMSFKVNSLIIKILKYSGIMAVLILWPKFLNDILINFVTTVGGIVARDTPELTADLTQPQILFLKAATLIQPAMAKIGAFSVSDYVLNLPQVLMIFLMTFAVLGVFIFLAIKITLVYIEFYVVGALSLVTVPFGSWSMSKFIAEGPLGHLISTALKLLVISFMVGMCVLCIKDAHADNIFDASPISTSSTTKPGNSTGKDDNKEQTGDKDKTPTASDEPNEDGQYVLKGYGKTVYATNPYVPMIWNKAIAMGVDPYLALAIAARETGGDDIDAIYMDPRSYSAGLFQINNNQSIQDPVTGETISIEANWPDYRTNPDTNIYVGLLMLKDKIRGENGNIWLGVRDYNGSPQREEYMQQVQLNYTKLSGLPASHLGNTGISAESLAKYSLICTILIILAVIILIVPDKVIKVVEGPLEIGG